MDSNVSNFYQNQFPSDPFGFISQQNTAIDDVKSQVEDSIELPIIKLFINSLSYNLYLGKVLEKEALEAGDNYFIDSNGKDTRIPQNNPFLNISEVNISQNSIDNWNNVQEMRDKFANAQAMSFLEEQRSKNLAQQAQSAMSVLYPQNYATTTPIVPNIPIANFPNLANLADTIPVGISNKLSSSATSSNATVTSPISAGGNIESRSSSFVESGKDNGVENSAEASIDNASESSSESSSDNSVEKQIENIKAELDNVKAQMKMAQHSKPNISKNQISDPIVKTDKTMSAKTKYGILQNTGYTIPASVATKVPKDISKAGDMANHYDLTSTRPWLFIFANRLLNLKR